MTILLTEGVTMAALMGAMIVRAGEQERSFREMQAAYELLKATGGAYSFKKTCELLDMDENELNARLVDRSILGLLVHMDVYIPALQFEGKNHIPYFHDIWDLLHPNCSPEEVCKFFALETLEPGGPCIRNLLCAYPGDEELYAIKRKAAVFRAAI